MGGIDLSAVNARSLGHGPPHMRTGSGLQRTAGCATLGHSSSAGAREELGPEEGKVGMGEPGASPPLLRGCPRQGYKRRVSLWGETRVMTSIWDILSRIQDIPVETVRRH